MKKLLVILLAAMMILSATSCSSREESSSSAEGSSSSTSSSQSSESSESDGKQKEAEEKLSKMVKSEYGKDARLKFIEAKEVNGEKCFVYQMDSGVVAGAILAISENGENVYQKEMGSGSFLPIDPVVTPATYFIDLLQTTYAGHLVKDVNAVANQIKNGTYSSYPADFVEASQFPTISDTEQLIYLYCPDTYLDEEYNPKKIVRIVLPVSESHAMLCDPSMVDDGTSAGKKLALNNFTFEKDFNLEEYAKTNGFEILKGSMVK